MINPVIEKRRESVARCHAMGMTGAKIADLLSLSRHQVRSDLLMCHLKPNDGPTAREIATAHRREKVRRLMRDVHLSDLQIAAKVRVSLSTIKNDIKAIRREGTTVTRTALPTRRPNCTVDLVHHGHALSVTIGYDLTGQPQEVFAAGYKQGSEQEAVLSDACVVLSIALQSGISAAELGKSLGTVPAWVNGELGTDHASLIGAVVAAVGAA